MSPNTIFFCEDAAHVDAARASGKAEILALTPAAAWACQKRGIPYHKLEDFYSPSELSAQYLQIFATELRWLSWLDGYLQQIIPDFARTGFRAAGAYQGLLMVLLDEYFAGQYILRRVLEQTRPVNIMYWPDSPAPPPDHLQHLRSIVPALLPQIAAEAGSTLIEFAAPPSSKPASRHSWNPASVLNPSMKAELRFLRWAGPAAYLRSLLSLKRSGEPVLFLGQGYDLDPLVLALRRKGRRTEWLDISLPSNISSASSIHARLVACWPEACVQPEFWSPFAEWGLTPPVRATIALRHWWQQIVPRLWAGFHNATMRLQRKQYAAAVGWEACAGTISAPALQASAAAKIPRILYQHGSTARLRVCDSVWYGWLANSEIFLSYGPVMQKHIEQTQPIGHSLAQVVPIGSARLETIRQRMTLDRIHALRAQLRNGDSRPLVLYIPMVFGGYGRDVSGELCGYPNVSYFELQQLALIQFRDFPNVRLLYKDLATAAGWPNPTPEFIQQNIPNAQAIFRPPLAELVWAVDAIIVDHVITALGEAALTSKPLIVYDGGSPGVECEPSAARAALERRAKVAATPAEFVAAIRYFLAANDFSELLEPDDAFLRACVTHQNDGKAADRAADLIIDICGKLRTPVKNPLRIAKSS
jgi:hypothetical protein